VTTGIHRGRLLTRPKRDLDGHGGTGTGRSSWGLGALGHGDLPQGRLWPTVGAVIGGGEGDVSERADEHSASNVLKTADSGAYDRCSLK